MPQTPTPSAPPQAASRKPFLPLVFVAGAGGSYWLNFLWFYLDDRWGRDPVRNLLLNAMFGLLYTFGCWTTARAAARHTPRSMLQSAYALMILMTLASSLVGSVWMLAIIILIHGYVISRTWPNLEMLATRGRHGEDLGRAISLYNIGWALTSAATYAVGGPLYKFNPWTFFLIPCALWAGAILLVRLLVERSELPRQAMAVPRAEADEAPPECADPALAASMRDLSRIGNMACYILLSVLAPIMPAVAKGLGLDTAHATLFGSIWLVSRVASFLVLGRWHGWHFRRGMFFGWMLALPALFAVAALAPNFWIGVAAQIALGFTVGAIYTSALFYSMHGEAKTSEAAMHELVIGLGIMAGPLLSAVCGRAGAWLGGSERIVIVGSVVVVIIGMTACMYWKAGKISPQRHRATENANS